MEVCGKLFMINTNYGIASINDLHVSSIDMHMKGSVCYIDA